MTSKEIIDEYTDLGCTRHEILRALRSKLNCSEREAEKILANHSPTVSELAYRQYEKANAAGDIKEALAALKIIHAIGASGQLKPLKLNTDGERLDWFAKTICNVSHYVVSNPYDENYRSVLRSISSAASAFRNLIDMQKFIDQVTEIGELSELKLKAIEHGSANIFAAEESGRSPTEAN